MQGNQVALHVDYIDSVKAHSLRECLNKFRCNLPNLVVPTALPAVVQAHIKHHMQRPASSRTIFARARNFECSFTCDACSKQWLQNNACLMWCLLNNARTEKVESRCLLTIRVSHYDIKNGITQMSSPQN